MLDKQIIDFNESILGLRDFIGFIDPILTEKFKKHDGHITPLLMSGMLKDMMSKKTEWAENEKEKFDKLKEEIDDKIIEIYKKPVEVEIESADESEDETKKSKTVKLVLSKSDGVDISTHVENAKRTREHINLLYKNSLMSLMSSVEWFFSQILHHYYDKFPESAGIQKKTMTLSELKGFESINDAEKYLIDIKIEEILRGSFDSWISLLKSELQLNLGYIDPIKEELIEFYQRRNIIVHNGGIVNTIYISKVNENFRKGVKIKDSLNVDKEYLDNVICKLQKAFILIAAELWKKLDKDDKMRGDVLTDIIYENVLKSKWDICEGLSYFVINDAQLEPVDKVVAQLNYWLAKKRLNNYKEVEKDINKTDYSDKKEIFQLGLLALKEDKENFFEILPAALDSGQLNTDRLEEFPIFEEMRQTEEYKKFKLDTKYFKEPNKTIDKIDDDKKE